MNRPNSVYRPQRIAVLLVIVTLVVTSMRADAAYRILRPIAIGTYGYILQTNLYGENSWVHKGVDFPAALDTSVYAVADGVVQQVKEDGGDNCTRFQCGWFGNFILIRHNQPHYDRTTRQTAYVYALYAHLSELGAHVNVGDPVSMGQDIGDVDNTGNSTGNHLHLQIMIDPDPNRIITDPFNLTWTETTSRNPELWLTPYNGTTGTVVGKVTNTNGDPVGGRFICGLQKQAGWGYGWNVTYNDPSLNPDDILVENWGTTDVTPGTYEVRSCPPNTCTSGCISMGTHTVEAGRITYVGLFPVWLPFVRGNYGGWNSTLYVRNNSPSYRAQVNTTYFDVNGIVQSQRTDYVNAHATLAMTPPSGFSGAALVVSSEDIAVAVLNEHTSPLSYSAYAGVTQPTTTAMIPLIHRNNSGWNSQISIQNTGPTAISVTVNFKSGAAGNDCTQTYPLAPGATVRVYTESLTCLGAPFIGSAQVTASQPLAVASLQYNTNFASLIESSNATGLASMLYAPLIQNNNSGYNSGFNLQNASNVINNLSVTYYTPDGVSPCSRTYSNVGAYRSITQHPAPHAGCTSVAVLSTRFSGGSQPISAMVNQLLAGTPQASGYEAVAQPMSRAYVARVFRNTTWTTGLQVQNAGTASTTVTITYYNSDGTVHSSQSANVPANAAATFVPVPPSAMTFDGSAMVSTNPAQNIAVVVNWLKTGSGDILASHIALNR